MKMMVDAVGKPLLLWKAKCPRDNGADSPLKIFGGLLVVDEGTSYGDFTEMWTGNLVGHQDFSLLHRNQGHNSGSRKARGNIAGQQVNEWTRVLEQRISRQSGRAYRMRKGKYVASCGMARTYKDTRACLPPSVLVHSPWTLASSIQATQRVDQAEKSILAP